MLFLDFFIKEWLSQVPSTIGGAILKGAKTLFFSLDTFIYKLIIDLYDMFINLCTVRLLSNDTLQLLSERIGIVLGVVMLFFVILSFVQMLLNPDAITDKEKGAVSIIKKTIIVIVMLGVSNYAFSALYNVQKIVVESNIISKILLPYRIETEINGEQTSNTETVMDNQKFGSLLSEELFMSFYRLEEFQEDAKMSIEGENLYTACQATVNAFRTQIINYNRFDLGYNCLNEDITVSFKVDNSNSSNEQETSIVNFNWPLSVICGIFVVYMIFMYCLKVGVRMVQLMFLEIISPMAFVSYLSPKKDTMFNKWEKMYFATYIDVFIRIAIINFVFFLIATLFSTNGVTGLKFSESMSNVNGYTKSFYTVVIILALLTFAKKAPDLLKSLLSESASKLGFGASMKDIVGLQKGAKIGAGILGGAAGGAAIGLLSMSPGGAIGGLLKGGFSGLKGQGFTKTATGAWKSERDSIKKMRDIRENGGGWLGSHIASVQGALGIRNAYERDETSIANAQMIVDTYNDAESEAKSEVIKNRANYSMTSFDGSAHSLAEYEALKTDQRLTSSERANYGIEYDRLLKSATQFTLDYGAAMENGIAAFDNSGNFTDAMDYATGTVYNTVDIDSMSTADRETLMGATNAKIEVGMAKLGGKPHSGRGSSNKKQRNDNSTYIHTLKNSKEYKSHKTNAGK